MPKKGKKGGGGGVGGKSEEDKLLSLQQRAQAEEEQAKKKEEMLTMFLKDKLQKEEKNAAVNLLKLNEGWRAILRQTRAAELRKDIDVLSQTFERQLDGLDDVIKSLGRDLQEAERQSAQVRRLHVQHVDRLRAQQDKRLMVLQQQWEDGLQHLRTTFKSERKQMLAQSQQQRADLEDAKFTLEQQHKEVMDEIHRLYSESIASYESAHEDRMAALVLEGKMALKERTRQNQETLQLHSKCANELEAVVLKNQRHIQKTEEKTRTIKDLQETISQLKAKLNAGKLEKESMERDLTAAREEVNQKTRNLCTQLTRGQAAAWKELMDLTMQSNDASKKLKAVIAKGERVLRVGEMCRKLERKLGNIIMPEDHGAQTQEEDAQQDTYQFPELRRLTRCIHGALLHREDLRKQRGELGRENRHLRQLLRQRLDAMTVNNHTRSIHHALLSMQRVPTTAVLPETNRRHAVVEALNIAR